MDARKIEGAPDTRKDRGTADMVEQAVSLSASKGAMVAANFLLSQRVKFSVIVRTLSEPNRRR